jgi:hypothetical protein
MPAVWGGCGTASDRKAPKVLHRLLAEKRRKLYGRFGGGEVIDQAVTPAEIAAELGMSDEQVLAALDELGARPDQDWRGRPMVRAEDARKLREKARAEETERIGRQMAMQAASRSHGDKVQAVFAQALGEARQVQRRKMIEAIKARVEGDDGFTSMTFNGLPEPGATFPLDPVYEQRAQQAARRAQDEWLERNPLVIE